MEETDEDVSPEIVLNAAVDEKLEDVIVIGWNKAGDFHFASSAAYKPDILWLLERARLRLADPDV